MGPDDTPDPHAVPDWLLGRWRLLRADAALDFAPGVCMDFRPGGRLLYSFDAGSGEMRVALVYQIDGDVLRTDNPNATHVAETRFHRGEAGVLVFDFAGARAWFVKEEHR